ncbi:MAG TPA: CAP domain-containing protein [Myxococcales bacterium]|nr:CAP domain-containing protein [Myxococcales bacterium]
MTRRLLAQAAASPAAVLLLLAGCAASMTANKRTPGVIENDSFKPARATAANYGPDPSFACPERGVNGLVQDDLGSQAEPEGRLCALADTLLGWPGSDEDIPPENVLSVLSHDFGLPQTVRRIVITNVNTAETVSRGPAISGATEKDLATMMEAPIRTFLASASTPRYGLVTMRVKQGLTRVVIAMQDQSLDLKPLPRKLNPGQSATLTGTVLGNLTNPKVQFTDATGNLTKTDAGGGKTVTAELKCGDRPGRMIVNITAEHEGADVQLANFPIGCAIDLPVAVAMPTAKPAGPADPAETEKQLATLLNQDRTTAGLKPLAVDEALAGVARSLSEDRAKGRGTTGDEVQKRLQAADISAPKILVSEAQAMNAEDAWTRFSNSPSDRANALNPEMTDVGIGVAPGAPVNNRPVMVVTYLYLKQLPPPNPEEIKGKLYEAIERRRNDARAGPLAKDPQLEEIAQKYATEMAADKGRVPKEKAAEIEAPLYKLFSTVNELGGVKADPLEFAEESGIVGDAKLVGVGVGIGTSAQFGKNSSFVVILLGKKHTAPAKTVRQPVKKKK